MDLRKLLLPLLLSLPLAVRAQSIWINEIHYDNSGIDTLEFVEIAVSGSFAQQQEVILLLYNGLTGTAYDSLELSAMTQGWDADGFTLYTWLPATIQNGPDGIALAVGDSLYEFLSYEDTITAVSGRAAGRLSTLLPVRENGLDIAGTSIGKTGRGSKSQHFGWQEPLSATPGGINPGQEFTFVPDLQINPGEIFFENVQSGEKGVPYPYQLQGVNLSAPLFIPVPEGFEISLSEEFTFYSTFPDTLIVPVVDDFLPPVPLFIRFIPGFEAARTYDQDLLHHSSGVTVGLKLHAREGPPVIPKVWINEFHYDNEGTDQNEFVEVVGRDVQDGDLPLIKIHLYNGSNGTVYNEKTLADYTSGDTVDGSYRFFFRIYPSIQNGGFNPIAGNEPDGFALSYQGRLLQFISYEGTFTATEGPAMGVTSQDIGISEGVTQLIQSSLQLEGDGYQFDDFSWWNSNGSNTMGAPNEGQSLPVQLVGLHLSIAGTSLLLKWQTTFEENNRGFRIEGSRNGKEYEHIGFAVAQNGNRKGKEYSYLLPDASYRYYRIVQEDYSGGLTAYGPVKNQMQFTKIVDLAPTPLDFRTRLVSSLPVNDQEELGLEVRSPSGQLLYVRSVPWKNRHLQEKILQSLGTGMYLIRIQLVGTDTGYMRLPHD